MQPDPHRAACGRIIVEVVTEAGVPLGFVGTKVAPEHAVSSWHVEGQDVGAPPDDHLPYQPRRDVTGIYGYGQDGVCHYSAGQLAPWA